MSDRSAAGAAPPAGDAPEMRAGTAAPMPGLVGGAFQRLRPPGAAMARHWLAAPANLRGSVLMVTSIFVSSVMMSGIKVIGTRLPMTEILMIRQLMVTLILTQIFRGNLR